MESDPIWRGIETACGLLVGMSDWLSLAIYLPHESSYHRPTCLAAGGRSSSRRGVPAVLPARRLRCWYLLSPGGFGGSADHPGARRACGPVRATDATR